MNPTPDHLDDEILSALLDGHAAAADPDVGSPDAAAHLRACDRCTGRLAELAAARAAMAAAPVEPLDELTRRRLLAGALRVAGEGPASMAPAARSRWAQRHPAVIGSAAAVVLAVLVGVPFVVGHGGSQADKTLSAAAPNAARESAGAFYGDLGDLTDRDRLRLRLNGAGVSDTAAAAPGEPGPSPAAGSPTLAPVAAGRPSSGGLAATPGAVPPTTVGAGGGAGSTGEKSAGASPPGAANSSSGFASDQAAGRDRADADACVAALLDGAARGGRLTGSGTGTFRGRPAIVAAFELSGGTVAFVADRAGCAVLDRFPL
ncbi:MAG TPA: hypothetical protein VEN99_06280 [Acidimicrobiia bacterium]|nr:hypothetical protein [Acidimicrobiia bacterium]